MSDSVNIPLVDQRSTSDKQLNEERARALEVIAQNLRQPLIDQLNWCELLMTDSERSLHREHLELVAKINSTANDLLDQVQNLLDEEKIQERARTMEHQDGSVPGGRPEGTGLRLVTDTGTDGGQADTLPTPAVPMGIAARLSYAPGLYAPRRLDAKILVVEDSSTLRELLIGVLRPTFHVLSAADGWEALKLMVERPDVIVTEVNVPSVDVADMLSHARRIAKDVAVLAVYDPRDAALVAAARRRGISETLRKPFPIAALLEKVEALVASRGVQGNKSVLVVCPDAREGYALCHLLDARYRTHFAPSVEAASGAAEDPFDVLIIDAAAGDYGWQNVVTLCQEANKDIRVLALIDGKDRAILGLLGQFGVNSAMLKPYSCDDLLVRVRRLLGIEEIDGRILRSVFRRAAI